jgi:hypothetical protein
MLDVITSARLRRALSPRNIGAIYIFVALFVLFAPWVPDTFLTRAVWRTLFDQGALTATLGMSSVLLAGISWVSGSQQILNLGSSFSDVATGRLLGTARRGGAVGRMVARPRARSGDDHGSTTQDHVRPGRCPCREPTSGERDESR